MSIGRQYKVPEIPKIFDEPKEVNSEKEGYGKGKLPNILENYKEEDKSIRIKNRLKNLIEKNGDADKKEKQLEGIDNNTPEQLLIKTTGFYNSFYEKQNFDKPFGIKVLKNASDGVFSLELQESMPDDVFEDLKGKEHEGRGRLVGNLLLATETSKNPLTITNQILNILERYIS